MAEEHGRDRICRNGGKAAERSLARLCLAVESIAPSVQRPALSVLEQRVRLLERLIPSALRCGDWESAARWEEQAAMAKHRAGLVRDGLESIFSEN